MSLVYPSQGSSIVAKEVTCACRYRIGTYSHDYCGNNVFSHVKSSEVNKWLFCDTCYLGKCPWCKFRFVNREGDG